MDAQCATQAAGSAPGVRRVVAGSGADPGPAPDGGALGARSVDRRAHPLRHRVEPGADTEVHAHAGVGEPDLDELLLPEGILDAQVDAVRPHVAIDGAEADR